MSNELDKLINDRLHNYESDVDAEAIWAAVKPERRRPWFLILLFFGGISILSGAYLLFSESEKNGEHLQNAYLANPTAKEYAIKEANLEQKEECESIHPSTENKETIVVNKLTEKENIKSSTLNKKIADTPKRNAKINVLSQKNDNMEKMLSKEQVVTDFTATKNSDLVIINKDESVEEHQQKMVDAVANSIEIVEESEYDLRQIAPINDYLPTLMRPISSPSSFPKDKLEEAANQLLYKKDASPWAFQVDAAYLFINRTLESENLDNWINDRLATESTLEAWSSDITLNYAINQSWQVRAGIGYTQINTQFSYDNISTIIDSVQGVQAIVYLPSNQVDSIYGQIQRTQTIDRNLNIYNSFSQWELPVLINYQARLNRFSVIGELGTRLRIRRAWEGKLLNPMGEVVSLENEDWYRSGLGISLQAGVHLAYQLSNQMQLRLGGSIRYSVNSFTKKDAAFKENYQLQGMQLGILFHLK